MELPLPSIHALNEARQYVETAVAAIRAEMEEYARFKEEERPDPSDDDCILNDDPDKQLVCVNCLGKTAEAGNVCDDCGEFVCADCGLSRSHWPCPE